MPSASMVARRAARSSPARPGRCAAAHRSRDLSPNRAADSRQVASASSRGRSVTPGSAAFMLIARTVVDTVNAIEDQDVFLRGLVRWLGYPLTTVPFARGKRVQGTTSYSLRRMVELAVTGIAAHSVRPLRFAVWLSLAFGWGLLGIWSGLSTFMVLRLAFVGWRAFSGHWLVPGTA